MKIIRHKSFLSWLLVFLWLGVIYFFSSQPNLKSDFQPVSDLIFRKIAHLSEYFVLAHLTCRAYRSLNISLPESLLFTLIIIILAASADEFHQLGVTGRVGSPVDITIDVSGGLLYAWLRLNEKYFKLKI